MIALHLIFEGPASIADLRQALEAHAFRKGQERLTPGMQAALDAVRDLSPSSAVTVQDTVLDGPEAGLVTYAEAGELLGVSPSTVSRRVREGRLERVERRIKRDSVVALMRASRPSVRIVDGRHVVGPPKENER